MRTLAVACVLLFTPSALANLPGWGQVTDTEVIIDLIRFEPAAEKVINTMLSKAPDGNVALSIADKRLPAPFDALKQVTVVTSKGVKKLELTLVGLESGAGEGHLLLHAKVPKGLKKGDHVYFPDQTRPYKGGPLRAVKPERPKAKVLKKLRKILTTQARRATRKGDPPAPGLAGLKAKHVSIVRGKFGSNAAFVAVKIKPENALTYVFSALFLVDKDFNVTEWLQPPRSRLEAFALHHLIDSDNDGADEVIIDSYYYEGTYTVALKLLDAGRLAPPRGSTRQHVEWKVLSGDGA